MDQADGTQDLLRMKGIDVVFPGVHALKGVDFSLRAGEVHALVGENGAGKSTLMKVLTGIYTDYAGEIRLAGEPIRLGGVKDAQQRGISIVHQELNLLNHLTVAQNIYIGRESGGFFFSDREINRRTQELIDRFHMQVKATDRVSSLSVGKLQMVEIARAMSYEATRVLILDEPTASLTDREVEELFEKMRDLRDQGMGIVFISHRMEELKQIADRITVMRDGEYIGTVNAADTDVGEIIQMMVGRTILQQPKTQSAVPPDAPVVLEAKNLCSGEVRDVSFTLRKGEILGVSGLVGAGRTEAMRLIFGADPRSGGEIWVKGEWAQIRTPADAVRHGIGYLSEDRKRYGLQLGLSVLDNILLGALDRFTAMGLIKGRKAREAAAGYVESLRVKTPSQRQLVKFLSGGNQQKVIIAKWLLMDMDILIFDEPTRGIDVGAKSEIYELMNRLAAQGKSIIMVSSELPEVLRMSDRVVVMCEGRKSGELDIAQADSRSIMEYATCSAKEGDGDDE